MKDPTKCKWSQDMFGIWICKGNCIPCERVQDKDCEMTDEYKERLKKLIGLIKEQDNE